MAVSDTASRSGGWPGRIIHGAARLFLAVVAWNDARMTRNALSQLTDRELDDIGLTRADIDRVARTL